MTMGLQNPDNSADEQFVYDPLPSIGWDMVANDYVKRLQPIAWRGAARKLRDAAEIIFSDQEAVEEHVHQIAIGNLPNDDNLQFPNHGPAYMLYGFAFENLLKGLIVAKEPDLIAPELWQPELWQPDQKRPASAGSWMIHYMDRLVSRAKLTVEDHQLRLLVALQHRAVWSGRYPVSKKIEGLVPLDHRGDVDFFGIQYRSDISVIRALFDQIDTILSDLISRQSV